MFLCNGDAKTIEVDIPKWMQFCCDAESRGASWHKKPFGENLEGVNFISGSFLIFSLELNKILVCNFC